MADSCSPDLPCDSVIGAWIRLVRAQRCTLVSVERALKEAGFPPLEWYDVLLELERAGPLRPRDLQARLLLPQSNLSRLLDRMDKEGVIDRNHCKEDARGQLVCASAKGKALRKRMWPVYADAIQRQIGVKLSSSQAGQLAGLLSRLSGCAPPQS